MPDDWHKIEHGLFESADDQWRIANPWKLVEGLNDSALAGRSTAS